MGGCLVFILSCFHCSLSSPCGGSACPCDFTQDDHGRLIWADLQNLQQKINDKRKPKLSRCIFSKNLFIVSLSLVTTRVLLTSVLTPRSSNSCFWFSFSVPLTFAHKVPVSLNSVPSRVPVSGGKYRHNPSPTIQLSSPSAPNFRGKPGRRQFTPNFRVPPLLGVNLAPS